MGKFVDGVLIDPKVTYVRRKLIERGPQTSVLAIVMHQTHSYSAKSTLLTWETRPYGAHFLIDRGGKPYTGEDGRIYQCVKITTKCQHVGAALSKCKVMNNCQVPVKGTKGRPVAATGYPDRFPTSGESIGIEFVGFGEEPEGKEVYADPSVAQTRSAVWLVEQLVQAIPRLGLADIYSHGEGWSKRPTEGGGFWNVLIASEIPILGKIVRKRTLGGLEAVSLAEQRRNDK